MTIDVTVPQTPGWWLDKGARELKARQKRYDLLSSYPEGNPPLPTQSTGLKKAVRDFQKKSRTNFAELIVGSTAERLAVRAIRTAVAADMDGDEEARRIARESDLEIELADAIENMLTLGDGYLIGGLDPENRTTFYVTSEDPRQVVTFHNPVRRSEVRAAVKMFHDPDEGRDYAFLYLPGVWVNIVDADGVPTGARVLANARRYVASRERKTAFRAAGYSVTSFDWDEAYGGVDGEELNHPLVPVVRVANRRSLGEFEPHLDVLDRINLTMMQRLTITAFQAYKMRALKVKPDDMPDEDEDGKPIDYDDVLTADPGAFLKIPDTAEIWESGQADMSGILAAIKDDVQHLMAVTRTPLSATDAINQSAEGAALIKEGQVFKTEDKQKRIAAALRQLFHLAFLALGDEARADKSQIVIDWAPAERHSLQQKYSAGSQARSAGVPDETIWTEVLQFSPETVALAKGQMWEQALRDEVTTGGATSGQPAAAPGAAGAAGVPAANGGAPVQA